MADEADTGETITPAPDPADAEDVATRAPEAEAMDPEDAPALPATTVEVTAEGEEVALPEAGMMGTTGMTGDEDATEAMDDERIVDMVEGAVEAVSAAGVDTAGTLEDVPAGIIRKVEASEAATLVEGEVVMAEDAVEVMGVVAVVGGVESVVVSRVVAGAPMGTMAMEEMNEDATGADEDAEEARAAGEDAAEGVEEGKVVEEDVRGVVDVLGMAEEMAGWVQPDDWWMGKSIAGKANEEKKIEDLLEDAGTTTTVEVLDATTGGATEEVRAVEGVVD